MLSERPPFNPIQRLLIWLSGSSEDALRECPRWEQRKYEAFGASVLVPTVFAMVASSYAVSTLTTEMWIIVPFAFMWGFIILTIDRVLLATYRAFANPFLKLSQFILRLVVAVLVGFTIAHPLTLLLFKDTIVSEVERERGVEIQAIRELAAENQTGLESKITEAQEALEEQQELYQETVTANFMEEQADPAAAEDAVPDREPEERAALETQIEQATQAQKTQIAELDTQMSQHNEAYAKVQDELSDWQAQYEAEVNGSRSGVAGIGPRAKSIEQDQLAWRRDEIKRLGSLMSSLTQTRNQLTNDIASTEKQLRDDYNQAVADEAAAARADRQEVATLQRQLKSQQLSIFMNNQEGLLSQIQGQIDSNSEELARLRGQSNQLAEDTQAQVTALQQQPRQDLLTQTLVLHSLFESGSEGGHFAMIVYVVIAGLFMLVDTIPLVVKFFSKAGPYDYLVLHQEELAKLAVDPFAADELSQAFVNRRMERFSQLKEMQDAAFSVAFGASPSRYQREYLEGAQPTPDGQDVPMIESVEDLPPAPEGEVGLGNMMITAPVSSSTNAVARQAVATERGTAPADPQQIADPDVVEPQQPPGQNGNGSETPQPTQRIVAQAPQPTAPVENRVEPQNLAQPQIQHPEPAANGNGNGDTFGVVVPPAANGNGNSNGNGAAAPIVPETTLEQAPIVAQHQPEVDTNAEFQSDRAEMRPEEPMLHEIEPETAAPNDLAQVDDTALNQIDPVMPVLDDESFARPNPTPEPEPQLYHQTENVPAPDQTTRRSRVSASPEPNVYVNEPAPQLQESPATTPDPQPEIPTEQQAQSDWQTVETPAVEEVPQLPEEPAPAIEEPTPAFAQSEEPKLEEIEPEQPNPVHYTPAAVAQNLKPVVADQDASELIQEAPVVEEPVAPVIEEEPVVDQIEVPAPIAEERAPALEEAEAVAPVIAETPAPQPIAEPEPVAEAPTQVEPAAAPEPVVAEAPAPQPVATPEPVFAENPAQQPVAEAPAAPEPAETPEPAPVAMSTSNYVGLDNYSAPTPDAAPKPQAISEPEANPLLENNPVYQPSAAERIQLQPGQQYIEATDETPEMITNQKSPTELEVRTYL
ncbi:MAG: DUF4407 domain-containing protein [Verrucomicrobiota bacterium]